MAGEELRELALREFANVVEDISDAELYESLKKKDLNINWMKIIGLLKKEILSELSQEWNDMWKQENLSEKINTLNKIKANSLDTTKEAWRPKTGDIEPQTVNLNMQLLTAIKNHYVAIGDREEEKLTKLKNELIAEWDEWKKHKHSINLAMKQNFITTQNIENSLKNNRDTLSQLSVKFIE